MEEGHHVAALDRDASAPGAAIADEFFEVSTVDSRGVLSSARGFGADAIVTAATDMPMRALSFACRQLGLVAPTEESVFRATDKIAMHHALLAHGVPVPRSMAIRGPKDLRNCFALGFPFVLKPSDSSGSRGLCVVRDREDVQACYEYASAASPTNMVLAQALMTGREVSVEGFCVEGTPRFIAVTDKLTTGAPHFVELGHSQPSCARPQIIDRIVSVARDAALALELNHCALHVEIMLTPQGPCVVELGARLGGDFITSHLTPLSTGVDMLGALVSIALGDEPVLARTLNRGAAVRFLGTPGNEDFVRVVRGLAGVVDAVAEGNRASAVLRSSCDRFGHVITFGDSAIEAVRRADLAVSCLNGEGLHGASGMVE